MTQYNSSDRPFWTGKLSILSFHDMKRMWAEFAGPTTPRNHAAVPSKMTADKTDHEKIEIRAGFDDDTVDRYWISSILRVGVIDRKRIPRLLRFLAWFGNKTQENCAFFDATNGFVATIRKNDIETIDNALFFNYSYIDWKAVVAQFAIRAIRCFYKGSKVALTNAICNFSYPVINPDPRQ